MVCPAQKCWKILPSPEKDTIKNSSFISSKCGPFATGINGETFEKYSFLFKFKEGTKDYEKKGLRVLPVYTFCRELLLPLKQNRSPFFFKLEGKTNESHHYRTVHGRPELQPTLPAGFWVRWRSAAFHCEAGPHPRTPSWYRAPGGGGVRGNGNWDQRITPLFLTVFTLTRGCSKKFLGKLMVSFDIPRILFWA